MAGTIGHPLSAIPHLPAVVFAKHLPPSAGKPRVLALDERAAAELPDETELTRGGPETSGKFDAVVGYAAPDELENLRLRLRPGGRLILAQRADPQLLLTALTSAGFIHCLVETVGEYTLYRGERPPHGSSVERIQTLNSNSLPSPFIFLLITQTPNKPAWTPLAVAPHEKLEWRAATVIDPATGQPALLAFSSLVKAVAFMQAAILAKWIGGVNKVGKFRGEAARTWALPFLLNPKFDDLRSAALGPAYQVDLETAILGDE